MTTITSLAKARKAKATAAAAKHGRGKGTRLAEALRDAKSRAHLDARRFEDE